MSFKLSYNIISVKSANVFTSTRKSLPSLMFLGNLYVQVF